MGHAAWSECTSRAEVFCFQKNSTCKGPQVRACELQVCKDKLTGADKPEPDGRRESRQTAPKRGHRPKGSRPGRDDDGFGGQLNARNFDSFEETGKAFKRH